MITTRVGSPTLTSSTTVARPRGEELEQFDLMTTSADGSTTTYDTVTFGDLEPFDMGSTHVVIGGPQGTASGVLATHAERVAAQALSDAIVGSGLIEQSPPIDYKFPPDAGLTRIFLNNRAHMIEFPTNNPPVVAQAVIDALAAYRLVAPVQDLRD
jgi:hypothetical protein